MLTRLFGVFVVVVVVERAPARATASVWCVRCGGGCGVSASSCQRICLVCSLLWWLSERQLVLARLFGVFVVVVVVE